MDYSIIQQDNDIQYDVVQYAVNTRADVAKVPTKCQPGSTIFVIEDSSVFMLTVDEDSKKRQWKEI